MAKLNLALYGTGHYNDTKLSRIIARTTQEGGWGRYFRKPPVGTPVHTELWFSPADLEWLWSNCPDFMEREKHVSAWGSEAQEYGLSFSSTMQGGDSGVRFKVIKYSHPERWESFDLGDLVSSQLTRALRLATAIVGKKYDLWGAIRCGLPYPSFLIRQDPERWYCSETSHMIMHQTCCSYWLRCTHRCWACYPPAVSPLQVRNLVSLSYPRVHIHYQMRGIK